MMADLSRIHQHLMCYTVSTLLVAQFVCSYLLAFAHILYKHAVEAIQKHGL